MNNKKSDTKAHVAAMLKKILILAIVLPMLCSQLFSGIAAAVPDSAELAGQSDGMEASSGSEDYEKQLFDMLSNSLTGSAVEDAGVSETIPSVPDSTYTKDFTWSSSQILDGIYSKADLYFNVPKYWDSKYIYLAVGYTVSQMIKTAPASLTFSINDEPFSSFEVKYKSNEMQIVYVQLPLELLQTGYNHLLISGYARLYDEQGCIDDNSNANWITISSKSYLRAGYDVADYDGKLSSFPFPFLSTIDPTGSETYVLVSDDAANGEIAAAQLVSAYLGSMTESRNEIKTGLWSDYSTIGRKKTILVGLRKNLPLEIQDGISDYYGNLEQGGLLLCDRDERSNVRLILVSETEEGLLEGARLLVSEDRVIQETNAHAYVENGTSEQAEASGKVSGMVADEHTLESVLGSGLSFIGPFHHIQTVYLPVTGDYVVSSTSKITLYFRYSKNLDFTRSMVTVYLDNIPVVSRKLGQDNADGDELSFSMPADMVGTSVKTLQIAFDLEIQDLICTYRNDEMPWAYVTKDSILYLPNENTPRFQFDSRPAPFQRNGSLNSVMLIVSDFPSSSELNLLSKILSVYYSGADSYGDLYVQRASEFSPNYADYNIITAGTCLENSFISQINDELFFQYDEDKTAFLSNDMLILADEYARNLGTLQLLQSPYGTQKALLVLTGPNEDAIEQIDKLASTEKMRWNLSKDCVTIDRESNIKTYQFKEISTIESKPGFIDTIMENQQSALFTLTALAALLVVLFSVILVLLRYKSRSRKD